MDFDITPEKRASIGAFMKRQLLSKPPAPSSSKTDLTGATAIVTGSNVGIGFEGSRQLLDLGLSKLILAVRSESKGKDAKADLERGFKASKSGKTPVIEVWQLDLSSYDSITAFAERTKSLEKLDIFVHNAGVMRVKFELNKTTGHEETVQVNYLSTALLTILLLPILKEKNTPETPGRLVIVNSDTAAWAKFKERDSVPLLATLDKPENFDPAQERYFMSKLLGQLFLSQLAIRVPSSVAIVNCVNPGLCYGSGLNRDAAGVAGAVFGIFKRVVGYPIVVGARSVTDAAVNHGAKSHGQYVEDGKVQPMAPIVYNAEGKRVAERLWIETMEELAFAHAAEVVQGLTLA
ncbi:hypothetical protein VMCG_08244 [Cytospora schulzeri]|uniref:Ketoreductase (KR) domain-containing protein n=1 Tax=Cytospora schulzeri TaxID=448051 RepID=A0A423VT21_9PEZI|nr:hypothetical protein VMCG_08244 [Valsa malicola]